MHARAAEFWLERGEFHAAIGEAQRSLAYRESLEATGLLKRIRREEARARAQQEIDAAARAEALGDLDAAAEGLERAVALDPERDDARWILDGVTTRIERANDLSQAAHEALLARDLASAETRASRALELHPQHRMAAFLLGTVRLERAAQEAAVNARVAQASGDWEAAVEFARRAVEAHSTSDRVLYAKAVEREAADRYLQLGDEAFRSRRWDQAIAYYERAGVFGGNGPEQRRNLQEARRSFELSLAREAEAHGDLDAASAHYRRANEIAPDAELMRELEQLRSRDSL
jgi:tetratricopeptide (TPR) repeat protein